MAENKKNLDVEVGDPNLPDNQLPDPSVFAERVGPKRERIKSKGLPEASGLSITSLMDALTIILVFLLKSYSNNPVQLKGGDDLKLPFSKASLFPAESIAVTLTATHIVVEDTALPIENGKVSESDLSGGGFLIEPLFQRLQDAVDKEKRVAKFNKNKEFEGVVTIISDRDISFKLITQVMYTAGQAQFSKFKFAVVNEDAS